MLPAPFPAFATSFSAVLNESYLTGSVTSIPAKPTKPVPHIIDANLSPRTYP